MSDTWANGYGRWHARVSRHAAAPLIAARRLIRDELLEREAPRSVHHHWWMHLDPTPEHDDADTIVYAEPTADPDDCDACARSIHAGTLKEDT